MLFRIFDLLILLRIFDLQPFKLPTSFSPSLDGIQQKTSLLIMPCLGHLEFNHIMAGMVCGHFYCILSRLIPGTLCLLLICTFNCFVCYWFCMYYLPLALLVGHTPCGCIFCLAEG